MADYDCYYWVEREDGNNVTLTTRGTQPRLRFLHLMSELLEREVEAGPRRDVLVRRHLEVDLNGALTHLMCENEPDVREAASPASGACSTPGAPTTSPTSCPR